MMVYLDCFSGISGDMTLGAMVDLGVPVEWIEDRIKSVLDLSGFSLSAEKVIRSGISATKVDVHVDDSTERDYARIRQIIVNSDLPDAVARKSLDMFERLAEAESGIHNCSREHVHFHELGGVDAIVDIVGAALCFDYLGITSVNASRVALGSGTVTCRHGRLPVPAPATLAILTGVPVYGTDAGCELVTPTGAAIITSYARGYDSMPDMVVDKIGYGAGQRNFPDRPNLLRILTGHPVHQGVETLEMVETCIDDMNPEIFGHLTDRLFAAGAADVYLVPVYMKKGRPGTLLQVLCSRAHQTAIADLILTETTAIGVRYYPVKRRVLEREIVEVQTPYGPVAAKRVRLPGGEHRITPEYESCRKIALENDLPVRDIYDIVHNCYHQDCHRA